MPCGSASLGAAATSLFALNDHRRAERLSWAGTSANMAWAYTLARLPCSADRAYGLCMTLPSNLDDPTVSHHAWKRYRRLMIWMATVALVATTIAITALRLRNPDASIHLYIAAAAGIFLSVLLGAALMGLVFLSSGTGHDEAIEDRLEDERQAP